MLNNSRFSLSRFFHSPVRILALALALILVATLAYVNSSKGFISGGAYTFQQSYLQYRPEGNQYHIVAVADMDTNSKVENDATRWKSVLKQGELKREDDGSYVVSWKEDKQLTSKYNEGGRGMELSELVYFNGKLLTCDDRSGLLFEVDIKDYIVHPLFVFAGNENREKGFKCEWMVCTIQDMTNLPKTVHDNLLYVGSMGKEWSTETGEHISDDPLWVKTVDVEGATNAVNWKVNYGKINAALGIQNGYMVHEAVNFDPVSRKWIFLPRRVSIDEKYNADTEGVKGSNTILIADEDFSNVEIATVGKLDPTHGFSSFKFIPHRHHEIVALKSVETDDVVETYIMVFDINTKKVLLEETLIGSDKCVIRTSSRPNLCQI